MSPSISMVVCLGSSGTRTNVMGPRCSRRNPASSSGSLLAAALGNDPISQVTFGGLGNFFDLYSSIITIRILLSWFPAAQGLSFLRPIYTITDPALNLFRGVIPPIFGLDLSPVLGLTLLQTLSQTTVALGAELSTKELLDSTGSTK